MACFITAEEENLPVPRKSRELKVCPPMVSISAAPYKSDDFHLVIVLEKSCRVAIRLQNGFIEFDDNGCDWHQQIFQESGDGHWFSDNLRIAVQEDLHSYNKLEKSVIGDW